MIELLERQEIFKLNKIFASFIIEGQEVQYNPMFDYNKYFPELMLVDDEAPRFVTQAECDQWNEEENEEYLRKKDSFESINIAEKHVGEIVYNLSYSEIDTYVENLADGILKLAEELNWQSVLFLLDYSTPWLYQKNNHKPVKKALDYLRKIGVTDTFIGGFKASGEDLRELIKNLFWIIRCNAALPDCCFSGVDTGFTADICKYGNIHFHFYSAKDKRNITKAAKAIGMLKIKDGQCFEKFSVTGAIKGRQIITS